MLCCRCVNTFNINMYSLVIPQFVKLLQKMSVSQFEKKLANKLSKNGDGSDKVNGNKNRNRNEDGRTSNISENSSIFNNDMLMHFDSNSSYSSDAASLHRKFVGVIPDSRRLLMAQCANCLILELKQLNFRTCSRCKHVQYCSRNCQRQHWKYQHRHDCPTLERRMLEEQHIQQQAQQQHEQHEQQIKFNQEQVQQIKQQIEELEQPTQQQQQQQQQQQLEEQQIESLESMESTDTLDDHDVESFDVQLHEMQEMKELEEFEKILSEQEINMNMNLFDYQHRVNKTFVRRLQRREKLLQQRDRELARQRVQKRIMEDKKQKEKWKAKDKAIAKAKAKAQARVERHGKEGDTEREKEKEKDRERERQRKEEEKQKQKRKQKEKEEQIKEFKQQQKEIEKQMQKQKLKKKQKEKEKEKEKERQKQMKSKNKKNNEKNKGKNKKKNDDDDGKLDDYNFLDIEIGSTRNGNNIVFGTDFIKNERGKWECLVCKTNKRRAESDSRQAMLKHVKQCLQNKYGVD